MAGSRTDHQLSGMMEGMTTPAGRRRHLATSPFRPDPEPIIEQYAINDLVSHDSYGMGRVVQVEAAAVTVDFGPKTVRVMSPFHKMTRI
jgi:hypothetical protein